MGEGRKSGEVEGHVERERESEASISESESPVSTALYIFCSKVVRLLEIESTE